jgi:hypothetical protein
VNNYQPRAPHPERHAAELLAHDSSRNVMQQVGDPERRAPSRPSPQTAATLI